MERAGLDRVHVSDSLNDKDTMLSAYNTHTHTLLFTFVTLCSFLSALRSVLTCLSVCLSECLSVYVSVGLSNSTYALLTRYLRGFTAMQPLNYNTVKMFRDTQWQLVQCHWQSCFNTSNQHESSLTMMGSSFGVYSRLVSTESSCFVYHSIEHGFHKTWHGSL